MNGDVDVNPNTSTLTPSRLVIRVDGQGGELFKSCFRHLSTEGQGKVDRKAADKGKKWQPSSNVGAEYRRRLFEREMDKNMWCAEDFTGKWFLFRTRTSGNPYAIVRAVMADETSADETSAVKT